MIPVQQIPHLLPEAPHGDGVEPLAPGRHGPVLLLLPGVELQPGQLFQAALRLLGRHVLVLKDQPLRLARLVDHLHLQKAVDVVGEADAHRLPAPRGRGHGDLKLPQQGVVRAVAVFPLIDPHVHLVLAVPDGVVNPHFAGGEDAVALDDGAHQVPFPLAFVVPGHPQGEGAHVGEDQLFKVPRPGLHPGADARPQGDGGVGAAVPDGLFMKGPGDVAPDGGHVAGAPHHHQVVQLLEGDAAVQEDPLDGGGHPPEEGPAFADQPLVGKGQGGGNAPVVHGHDHHLLAGQGHLAGLPLADQQLLLPGGEAVEVQPAVLAKAPGNGQVEIGAPQAVVPADGGDADHVPEPLHQGNVQGAAPQVEDQADLVRFPLADAARHRGGGGLVYQPLRLQPRKGRGPFRGGALGLGKVGGDADHRLLHRLFQIGLRVLPQGAEHQGGKLLRREGPAAQAKGLFRAHKALEPGGGPLRVGDEPVPGRPAHQDGAVLVHADRAGGQELPGGVGDKLAAPVPPHGGQGVGGAQIDADDCHALSPLSLFAEPIIAPGKGVCKGERRRRGLEKNGGPGIYGRGVLKKRRVLI